MKLEDRLARIVEDLSSSEMQSIIQHIMEMVELTPKWMLYSDYCLDDKTKPNDVITFVLVPFVSENQYKELEQTIKKTQPEDLKHSQHVNSDFMDYIKHQPIFSFSFIVNNRQLLFGTDEDEQKNAVMKILENLKSGFQKWRDNSPEGYSIDYYKEVIKKLKHQQNEVFNGKNIKHLIDIYLITFLGAFFTAEILKQLPKLEIFGWFPDRDKTNEACDQLATPIFNAIQHDRLGASVYEFAAAAPDSTIVPFYDDLNRIADVICGTLADYNIEHNKISADKFDEILQGLIADNERIRVYRLKSDEEPLRFSIIHFFSKDKVTA